MDQIEGNFYDVAGKFAEGRRTEIVEDTGLPVDPNLYHVYFDVEQGTWGDRKNLVLMTLTGSELDNLHAMTPENVKAMAETARRYFGDVAEASARRHLTSRDLT